MGYTPSVVIVTRPTRLQGLRERWGTLGQARFLLGAARAIESDANVSEAKTARRPNAAKKKRSVTQADFDEYAAEDAIYQAAVDRIETELQTWFPTRVIPRNFVPSFDFALSAAVVVVGQDGLVANVAKYVGDVPIVAVNPDPSRIDGVLLPFEVDEAAAVVRQGIGKRFDYREVTLAEANLNDGQRMLAFNDFFIGAATHVSARYVIEAQNQSEPQSSSGVLVCTGAGSTGWISSVFNMTDGIARTLDTSIKKPAPMNWNDRQLRWVVREPFLSRTSRSDLVTGKILERDELKIESLMPDHGVIFSDGIEADFLPFNSGSIVRVGVSTQTARLVVP